MPEIPDLVVLARDRDLEGRKNEIWVRRALFALLPVVSVVALLNVFGQRPTTSTAAVSPATLSVDAPSRLRGGLLFQARFRVAAREELDKARLVLGPGWADGITLNSIVPSPVGEASDDGRVSFDLGRIRSGSTYVLYVEGQVNSTNVGRREADVTLYDDDRELAEIQRTITIFP